MPSVAVAAGAHSKRSLLVSAVEVGITAILGSAVTTGLVAAMTGGAVTDRDGSPEVRRSSVCMSCNCSDAAVSSAACARSCVNCAQLRSVSALVLAADGSEQGSSLFGLMPTGCLAVP